MSFHNIDFSCRKLKEASIFEKIKVLRENWQLVKSAKIVGPHAQAFYELMTAPTTKILEKWYNSAVRL